MGDTDRFKDFVKFINDSESNGGQLEQALTNSANKLNEMKQFSNELKGIWLAFGNLVEPIFDKLFSAARKTLMWLEGNIPNAIVNRLSFGILGDNSFKSVATIEKERKYKNDYAKLQGDLSEAKTKDEKFKVINSQTFLSNTQKFEELAKINVWAEKNPLIANIKTESANKEQSKLTTVGNKVANAKAGENVGLGGSGNGGGGYGGNDTRNVTVNIQKLVEKIEVTITNGSGLTSSKIKEHVEEVLIAAVRDSELALAHR
jgi:hypothetical protein